MLKPLPQENLVSKSSKNKVRTSAHFRLNKNPKASTKAEQKELIKLGHNLKNLGKSPDNFPQSQLKKLVGDVKMVVYTLRKLEIKRRSKKKNKGFEQK
jgi:hypothetical protein